MKVSEHVATTLVLVLSATLVALLAIPPITQACADGAVWASWTQGIGSIAAIFAGALAIRWQVKAGQMHDRSQRARDDIQRINDWASHLSYCEQIVGMLEQAFATPDTARLFLFTNYKNFEFPLVSQSLFESTIQEIPDPGLKIAFLSARSAFETASQAASDAWQMARGETLEHRDVEHYRNIIAGSRRVLILRVNDFRNGVIARESHLVEMARGGK
jgi:hypothetical protein